MQDFLKTLEAILIDMWNYLHDFLNYILEGKTDGDTAPGGDVPPIPMD